MYYDNHCGIIFLETFKNVCTYFKFVNPKTGYIFKHVKGEKNHLKGMWAGQFNVIGDHNLIVRSVIEYYFFDDSNGFCIEKDYLHHFNSKIHSWWALGSIKKEPFFITSRSVRVDPEIPNYFNIFPLNYINKTNYRDMITQNKLDMNKDDFLYYRGYMIKDDSLFIEGSGWSNKKYIKKTSWLVNPVVKIPIYKLLNPFYVRKIKYYP